MLSASPAAPVDLSGRGDLRLDDLRPGGGHDVLELIELPPSADQRIGTALLARPGGPSDAVHIEFNVLGNIKVEDSVHILHIDASGRHIGGNENPGAVRLEAAHHLGAGRLAHIAVDAHCLVSGAGQVLRELVHHLLGVAEHHRQTGIVLGQQQIEHIHLAPHRTVKIELLNVLRSAAALAADGNHHRIPLVLPGDLQDGLGHGG